MNTLKMFKKNMIVEKSDLQLFVLIPVIGALFGIILATAIYLASGQDTYLEMGSMMVLFAGGFCMVFGAAFSERQSFTLAVTMGVTRGNYMFSRYLVLVLDIIFTLLVCGLTILLEKNIFPGAEHETIFELSSVNFVLVIVFCLVFPIISMFMGMLYVRFERKFFWVMWGLWMLLTLGAPRIMSAMNNRPDSAPAKVGFFLVKVIDGSAWYLTAIGVAVVAVITFFTIKLYKTQSITA